MRMIFEPFSEIGNWKIGLGAVEFSESLSQYRTNFTLHDELNGFRDLVGHNSATYIIGLFKRITQSIMGPIL